MTQDLKFIFVGGCGRSGTTLVQKLLVSHQNVAGGPEFPYTRSLMELHTRMTQSVNNGSISTFVDHDFLKTSFKDFYTSFFHNYQGDDVHFLSEKTPANVFVIPQLLSVFQDAVFVNVHRDGRAVLASHMKVRKRARQKGEFLSDLSVKKVSRLWNSCIDQYWASNDNEQINSRIFNIRYEALIENPVTSLKPVFEYLNLELPENIMAPDQIKFDDAKYDAHVNDIWYTSEMYNQNYNKENIDKWRRELTGLQKFYGSIIMAKHLKALGYDISGSYIFLNGLASVFSWRGLKEKLKSNKGIVKFYLFLKRLV